MPHQTFDTARVSGEARIPKDYRFCRTLNFFYLKLNEFTFHLSKWFRDFINSKNSNSIILDLVGFVDSTK